MITEPVYVYLEHLRIRRHRKCTCLCLFYCAFLLAWVLFYAIRRSSHGARIVQLPKFGHNAGLYLVFWHFSRHVVFHWLNILLHPLYYLICIYHVLEQITITILNSLMIGIALAAWNFSQANLKGAMNIANWITRIINFFLWFTLVEAMMHKLKKRLHKLCSISFSIQTKFLNLLFAVIMLKQLSPQIISIE